MRLDEKVPRYSYKFSFAAGAEGSPNEELTKSDIQAYINELLEVKKPQSPKEDLLTV